MTSLSSYYTNRMSSIAVRASLSRITHYALYTDHTLHIDDITKFIFTKKKIAVNKTGGERLMIFLNINLKTCFASFVVEVLKFTILFKTKFENTFCQFCR